jgi:hypothetical protein
MAEPEDDAAALDGVDEAVAKQLRDLRAVPGVAFRGALERRLAVLDPGYGPRPERLRTSVAVWLVAGLALLVVGAVVAGGIL